MIFKFSSSESVDGVGVLCGVCATGLRPLPSITTNAAHSNETRRYHAQEQDLRGFAAAPVVAPDRVERRFARAHVRFENDGVADEPSRMKLHTIDDGFDTAVVCARCHVRLATSAGAARVDKRNETLTLVRLDDDKTCCRRRCPAPTRKASARWPSCATSNGRRTS